MCDFFSAIVIPNEARKGGVEIFHNQYTDSHEELVSFFKLKDKGKLARIEFKPDSGVDLADLKKYKFRIDEARTPEWLDEEKQDFVKAYCAETVGRMIVSGDVEILLGGVYIIAKGANIGFAKQSRIIAVLSGGTVQRVGSGGTVQIVWSGGIVQSVESGGIVQSVLSGGIVQRVESGSKILEDFNEKPKQS